MALRISQFVPSQEAKARARAAGILTPYDLLSELPSAWNWMWKLWNIQTGGGRGAFALETWAKRGKPVSGRMLRCALEPGAQIWWGQLAAFEPGTVQAVLTVDAFDSTWYDITGRDDLLVRLGRLFS